MPRRDWLRDRRRALGLTQHDLADRIGVDAQTVGRWEAGTITPQLRRRALMAEALQLPRSQLDAQLNAYDLDATATTEFGDEPREPAGLDLDLGLHQLQQQWHTLVQAHNLWGPNHALPGVLEQLRLIRRLVRTYGRQPGLLRMAARYAESASWLYEDSADPRLARSWLHRATRWARQGEDLDLVTWTEYRRSLHDLQDGNAWSGLGRACLAAERALPTPMAAALAVVRGTAYGAVGELSSSAAAFDDAHAHASSDAWGDAQSGHGGFAVPAYCDVHRGWAISLAGRPAASLPAFQAGLDALPSAYRRDRALALVRLADTHRRTGEIDQAAQHGLHAHRIAQDLASADIVARVHTLAEHLRAHHRQADVTTLLADLDGKDTR